MKETICTIPINDIFQDTDGCPICRMHRMLEDQYVGFITGAAMMAPEVRIKTNEVGFCHRHFSKMLKGPRLSNALLLQTHLDEIRTTLLPKKPDEELSKKGLEGLKKLSGTCYVCDRIEHDIHHLMKTVYSQFGVDETFRALYRKQDYLCLDHYALVMSGASKKTVGKDRYREFLEATNALCRGYLDTLYDDVTHFASMFDYRNRGKDYENSKDAIERAITFLTSSPPTPPEK